MEAKQRPSFLGVCSINHLKPRHREAIGHVKNLTSRQARPREEDRTTGRGRDNGLYIDPWTGRPQTLLRALTRNKAC